MEYVHKLVKNGRQHFKKYNHLHYELLPSISTIILLKSGAVPFAWYVRRIRNIPAFNLFDLNAFGCWITSFTRPLVSFLTLKYLVFTPLWFHVPRSSARISRRSLRTEQFKRKLQFIWIFIGRFWQTISSDGLVSSRTRATSVAQNSPPGNSYNGRDKSSWRYLFGTWVATSLNGKEITNQYAYAFNVKNLFEYDFIPLIIIIKI